MDTPEKKKSRFFNKRSFKFGTMATIFTAVFVAVVILVNMLLSAVVNKYPISWDLTSTKKFAISTETKNYLKTLKDDIYISIVSSEARFQSDDTLNTAYQNLKQYTQYCPKIHMSFIDTSKNPAFASHFPSENLTDYDIIVAKGSPTGSKYKKISANDFFTWTTDSSTGVSSPSGNQTEETVNSALLYVTSSNLPKIVFTSGHNEADSSSFQDLLKKNNYSISTEDLSMSAVDMKTASIVIYAPTVDFTAKEIDKLNSFLTNNDNLGKNLFVFFDPQQPTLPNLETFLSSWGIKAEKGVIYDMSGYSNFTSKGQNLDTDVFKNVSTTIGTAVMNARPLTLLFDTRDNRTTKSLMQSSDTSKLWNTTDFTKSLTPSDSDKSGPFTVMAECTKTRNNGTENLTSNVFVSGTAAFVNSTLVSASNYNNASAIVSAFNSFCGIKSTLTVTTKSLESQTLSITQPQIVMLAIIFIFAIPFLILVAGFAVYFRRRHL